LLVDQNLSGLSIQSWAVNAQNTVSARFKLSQRQKATFIMWKLFA